MSRLRPKGRWVRAALVAALVLDLGVLGTNLFLLDGVSATTEVGFDDALADFREQTTTTTGAAVVAPVDPGPTSTSIAPGTTQTPTTRTEAQPSATTAPTTGPTAFQRPAQGLYRYRTTGGETISLLGARHDYPAETYASVRHLSGCQWHVKAEVVAEHTDERLMCSEPGRLLQLEQARLVTFFGTTDGGRFACDPPQAQHVVGEGPGSTSVSDCSGSGATARLTRRTLGTGTLRVGGTTVDVVRFRIDGVVTGRVQGTSLDLVTVDAMTGLPLVWERTVDNVADAFGSSIRYQEQARFTLLSLTPAT